MLSLKHHLSAILRKRTLGWIKQWFRKEPELPLSVVPNFDTRDLFCGRQFFHGLGGGVCDLDFSLSQKEVYINNHNLYTANSSTNDNYNLCLIKQVRNKNHTALKMYVYVCPR